MYCIQCKKTAGSKGCTKISVSVRIADSATHCFRCPSSQVETLEEVGMVLGLDVNELLVKYLRKYFLL